MKVQELHKIESLAQQIFLKKEDPTRNTEAWAKICIKSAKTFYDTFDELKKEFK